MSSGRLILGKGGRSILRENPEMMPGLWSGTPGKEARNREPGEEHRAWGEDTTQTPPAVGVYFPLPVGLFIYLTAMYQMLTEPGRLGAGHTVGKSPHKEPQQAREAKMKG